MRYAALLITVLLVAACGDIVPTQTTDPEAAEFATVRVMLVGDVMLGRGVATPLARESAELFAGVRHLLTAADVAGANLESPLTDRPHTSDNENQLEAAPSSAAALAAAGFDIVSLPNNHSTDAGPEGLVDTIAALTAAGLETVGAGSDYTEAAKPTIFAGPVTVGLLAFDATGVGEPAGTGPGIAAWEHESSLAAVAALRDEVDLLVVSVHGGTEYLPVTDPGMEDIAAALAKVGVDVVWGHGAHVVQPIRVLEGSRLTVTATSLGNFLFDQSGPGRTTGAMLEVLAGNHGVVAYRVGITEHPDRRVEFVEWLPPEGDAVYLHESWWTLTAVPEVVESTSTELENFRHGDLIGAAGGDITGDGATDVVASFRRRHRTTPLMELRPDVQWSDAAGRSAHLGVYHPNGLREIWVAGTVLMPIAELEVCDGAIATIHDSLDDPTIVAGGAWEWNGFGFDTAPDIPGAGTPACADIDGDGLTEPVILDR